MLIHVLASGKVGQNHRYTCEKEAIQMGGCNMLEDKMNTLFLIMVDTRALIQYKYVILPV